MSKKEKGKVAMTRPVFSFWKCSFCSRKGDANQQQNFV